MDIGKTQHLLSEDVAKPPTVVAIPFWPVLANRQSQYTAVCGICQFLWKPETWQRTHKVAVPKSGAREARFPWKEYLDKGCRPDI